MIQTELTTVELTPTSDGTVEITASTPSSTTVAVDADGIVSLNTIQTPGVEVLATSPDTVNISVVQESAVVITTDPTSQTAVIVDENGVVTISTVEETPVQLTSGPQQIVKLEPLEEVAVVLITAAQQGPAGPPGPIGPSGGEQVYEANQNLDAYEIVAVLTNGYVAPATCMNITYYGTVVGLTIEPYVSGATVKIANAGLVENPSWSFIPGQKVYVGIGGTLVQTVPDGAVFTQSIGTALTATLLLMNIEPPVLRNGGVNVNQNAALYSSYGTVLSTSTTSIDSFSAVLYRSAKYQIQISDGVNFEALEMFVLHDGVNVYLSSYGNIFNTASSMGFFDALLTTNTVSITFTANFASNKTIKFIRTCIAV